MNLLPAWPRHSINWNATLLGKVMHSTAGIMPEGEQGKGFFKGCLCSKAKTPDLFWDKQCGEATHHHPLKRLLCSYSKGQTVHTWGVPSKVHWPKIKACWSLSKRLIEIGGAASEFPAVESQTFDQMDVETDCCWVLALFTSLCGFLISFSTNSDAHTDFFIAFLSVTEAPAACIYWKTSYFKCATMRLWTFFYLLAFRSLTVYLNDIFMLLLTTL